MGLCFEEEHQNEAVDKGEERGEEVRAIQSSGRGAVSASSGGGGVIIEVQVCISPFTFAHLSD